MKKKHLILFVLMVMGASADMAFAQTLQMTSKQWKVFTLGNATGKSCYIASLPTRQSGNYSKRGEPFVMVTHMGKTRDEMSVSSGYPYKVNSETSVNIDGKAYKLFVKDDRAWAKDSATDNQMVRDMMEGTNMVVKGTSQRGTYSEDTYSLSGFTAAHMKMKELCK